VFYYWAYCISRWIWPTIFFRFSELETISS